METIDKDYNLRRTYHSKGFMGNGIYKSKINGKPTKYYKVWGSMLDRCYSIKFQKTNPKYINCTVCDEWLNFQVFAKWFEDNYIEGYELDKDILIKGNKIYSPETCCFVPRSINMLLSKSHTSTDDIPYGVYKAGNSYRTAISIDNKKIGLGSFNTILEAFTIYKIAKENEIKRKANQYKHIISNDCYLTLMNYTVEITD